MKTVAAVVGGIVMCVVGLVGVLFFMVRFRPRTVAAFNRSVTNRVTRRVAGRLPGFGIITHIGRTSGRVYRTPVNVFRVPGGFLVALTYGRHSEWVKNVLAAGGCGLETHGVGYRLCAPGLVHDPTRRQFPPPVRVGLRLAGATDYLKLSICGPAS